MANQTDQNQKSSILQTRHVNARSQSEQDFFGDTILSISDFSNPKKIKKGDINALSVVAEIMSYQPDLIICYGSSLIKSMLLKKFMGRFLNVHLGLSPYYRGSGTNVWPLVDRQPQMVGATFMHIDAGIDTGRIIHQIRAALMLGDSPHTIGNRLIKNMTEMYCKIILAFDNLTEEIQPDDLGKLYLQKDFDAQSCSTLYKNFRDGMVSDYLDEKDTNSWPYIVTNTGLK